MNPFGVKIHSMFYALNFSVSYFHLYLHEMRFEYFVVWIVCFMMTSLNGNIFRITGPLWGDSHGHRWIFPINASDAELWCFLSSALNKPFRKQSWRRWFEMPSCSSWCYCNDFAWWVTWSFRIHRVLKKSTPKNLRYLISHWTKLPPFRGRYFKMHFPNENCVFLLKSYWNLFLKVQSTITQHCFRYWLGAE